MKRKLKFLLICVAVVLFALLSVPSYATEVAADSARIYADGDGYVLEDGEVCVRGESVGELIARVPSGSCLTLDSVICGESITVAESSLTLTGTLTLSDGAMLVVDGGTLTLGGMSISAEGQAVRIKRGTLVFESGSISAEGDGVVMDFSASARYIQTGGVLCSSLGVALRVGQGCATVRGGRICSASDSAILSSSTLTLVGAPQLSGAAYDVSTSTPITLTEGADSFSGTARVRLLGEVRRGVVSTAFYTEGAGPLSDITLCSSLGESLPLRYLTAGEYGCEESCGAVWLPFFVTFSFRGGEEYVLERMATETVTPPTAPEVAGYTHTGWCYSDGESFDPSATVTEDTKVYATYSLNPPSYKMSAEDFAYDGAVRYISVTDITHPLIDEGYLSFEWYKDGVPLPSYTYRHAVREVADSGTYYAKITLTVGTDTASTLTPYAPIAISKRLVDIPEIPAEFYTGGYITPKIESNELFSVSEVKGVEVGIYPILVTLADPDNCAFVGTAERFVYASFEIKRAENHWLAPLVIPDCYTDASPAPSATPAFGEVRYLFAKRDEGVFSEGVPSAAGEYLVRAVVDGTDNYTALESETVNFSIIAECAVGISVKEKPYKLDYLAFETLAPEGIAVEVVYNSARVETVYSGSLTFSYQTTGADSLRYGDSGVNISYMGASVMLPVNVSRAEYDTSGIIFSDLTLVYDSTLKSIPLPEGLPVGLDGIPLCATVTGGGIGAAEYTVTLVFSTESRNYNLPEPISATLTVLPRESDVVWGVREFVYDGGEKLPVAFYIDILGRRIDLTVEGKRSLAGTYLATAATSDPNYTLKNQATEYTIKRADYDMSGAVWCGGEFVYDGSLHSVTLSGLPSGVRVIGYLNAEATLAGEYLASATLAYDERNYNPPIAPSYAWSVCRAEYGTGGYRFDELTCIYDGAVHYPTLVGELPVGLDGSVPSYTFSRGVTHVAEGRAAVTVSFSTDSRNYNPPPDIIAYVTIIAKEIAVVWEGASFTYNGRPISPRAVSEHTSVTVIGGGTDAGEYIARAVSDSPDYVITNDEWHFVIGRAENGWLITPSVKDIFFGDVPSPEGAALAGEVEYIYYESGSSEPLSDIPRAVGEYAVVAFSAGDKNYLPISSELLRFSVIAVVPVSISATLTDTPLTALTVPGEGDISALVHYNNGTSTKIPPRALDISYQRGDSPRYGDTEITVSYLGFAVTLSVSVVRADYDMSGARWENTLLIYDGTERAAYLTGLPSGVSVKEYISCRATAAGEYPLTAVLEYDRENYNMPAVPSGIMVIARQIVSLPTVGGVTYDGRAHKPTLAPSALYTASGTDSATEAGEYPITLTLLDPDNYTFPSGQGVAEVDFVIAKRPLTVAVDDVRLGAFESEYTPSYKIVEGSVAEGDVLVPTYTERDGKIYVSFDAENYAISVVAGSLERTGALSSRALGILIFVLLLLLLILLVVYLVLKHRVYIYCSLRRGAHRLAAETSVTPTPPPTPSTPHTDEKTETDGTEASELVSISVEYAEEAISDSLAKDLIRRDEVIPTEGKRRGIINVDTLSRAFSAGDRVDVNILKQRSLIPYDTAYIKVLARGVIDKPLEVYANDFSLSAVKMIALAGGRAIRAYTSPIGKRDKNAKKS